MNNLSTIDISELILHRKKFLSIKECNDLIKYFEINKNKSTQEHCPEASTNIDTWSTFDVIDVPCGSKEYGIVAHAIEKMINLYHSYTDKFKMFHSMRKSNLLYSHKIRLMKYETGAKIHPHSDHDPYVYGSCTFNLNEDYEGGDFVFFRGKKKIKLKQGDALIFPADHYWVHEVKPINKGVRYSVNCFLQSIPQSVREELILKEEELIKKYVFNPRDGIKYNINKEPN
jgi:hypothetical protein|tara:strand:+ start:58 stop:744 length:687 start_codon:yes stop_codon:yes gene_type:complete